MNTFGTLSSFQLLALVMAIARGIIPVVGALKPLSSTSNTATGQQLILKAPGATCGYVDGKRGESINILFNASSCLSYQVDGD